MNTSAVTGRHGKRPSRFSRMYLFISSMWIGGGGLLVVGSFVILPLPLSQYGVKGESKGKNQQKVNAWGLPFHRIRSDVERWPCRLVAAYLIVIFVGPCAVTILSCLAARFIM